MHAYLFFKDRWGAVFPRPLVNPKWRSYDFQPTCYPLPHYLVPHSPSVCLMSLWMPTGFQLCRLSSNSAFCAVMKSQVGLCLTPHWIVCIRCSYQVCLYWKTTYEATTKFHRPELEQSQQQKREDGSTVFVMRSVEADGALEREDGLGESWTWQKRLSSSSSSSSIYLQSPWLKLCNSRRVSSKLLNV